MPRWHSPKRRRNSSSRSPQKDRYASKKRFVSRSRSRSRSRKRSPQQYSRSPSPRYRPNRPGYNQSGRKGSNSPVSKRKQQRSSLNRNRSFSPTSRRMDSPTRYKDPPSGKDKRSGDYYKSNVRGRSFTPERKRSLTPKKRRSGGKDFIERDADIHYRKQTLSKRSRSRDGGNTKSYKRDRRNRSSPSPQRSRSRKKEYYDDQKHESHGNRPDVSSSPSSSRKHHDIDPSEIRININQSKPSPPRNKFNVEELVIPRRKDEGTKPLFDRPELRQRSYYDTQDNLDEERRVVSVKKTDDNTGYIQGMPVQELASRERNTKHSLESITNLDQFHRNTATFQYSSLSKLDIDNISSSKLNQNLYQSQQNTYSQIDLQPRNTVESTHQTGRNDTPMFSLPTGDLRHCLKSRRSPKDQSSHSQKEKRSQDRNYKRSRSRSSQDVGSRNLKASPAKHSVSERLQKLASSNQSQDNLPNFRKELEEIQKEEWKLNPTIVPRSSQYFVHDDRGRRNSIDDKGPPMKPKSPHTGFSKFSKRGTSFRGFGRGSSFSSRGSSFSSRGSSFPSRGFSSRRGFARGASRGTTLFGRGGKRSPTNWKHDMYDKRGSRTSKSNDSKYLKNRKEQSNRPSSTTGRK